MIFVVGMPMQYRIPKEHAGLYGLETEVLAALVTATHEDGTADLVVFPPEGASVLRLERVVGGTGPGEATMLSPPREPTPAPETLPAPEVPPQPEPEPEPTPEPEPEPTPEPAPEPGAAT